ncbi:MAG: hypothetical protein KDA86_07470 [Planctomycetaceae bacterium]|nr:hypothetical protein [Planctomycetaceae bacterium]
MARKTASRLSKRREVEAAEAAGSTVKKKKKATRKKKATTTRRKAKSTERKRLVWGVFSGSLKEEARFPYDQKKEAEAKLEQLLARGKRIYFIQPIKEVITAEAKAADEEAKEAAEEAESEE